MTKNSFGSKVGADLRHTLRTAFKDGRHIYNSPRRLDISQTLSVGGWFAIGGLIYIYDQELLNAIQRNDDYFPLKQYGEVGDFFEPLGFMAFTNKFYFATLIIGYLAGCEPAVNLSADILESYAISGLFKNSTNILIGRRRPATGLGPRNFKTADGTSFPSGHSLNVAQLAVVTSRHIDYLPYTIVAFAIAGSVMLQRIEADAHWPSDVYFGALFGIAASSTLMDLKATRKIKATPILGANGIGINISYSLDSVNGSGK